MNLLFRTILVGIALTAVSSPLVRAQDKPEEKLGWKLGAQAYTFSAYTFEQTLDTLHKLGVQYVQAYSGQKLGAGIDGTFGPDLDAAARANVLDLLRRKGMTLYSFGVASGKNEAEWRKLFEFVKALGLSEFASEPAKTALPLVARLAKEYRIKVALHDHPRPAPYWSPDTVVKYTKGYTEYLGACADIGHWVRSGIDPVEALKTLHKAGVPILELHLKDLNEKPSAEYLAAQIAPRGENRSAGPPPGAVTPTGPTNPDPDNPRPGVTGPTGPYVTNPGLTVITSAPRKTAPAEPTDVPWGTGVADIPGVMKELKRQGFKGGIFAEYESDTPANRVIQLEKSIHFFREKIKTL